MEKIRVNLGEKSYTIEIAENLLASAGGRIKTLVPKAEKIAVISDSNVAPLYGDTVLQSLAQAGLCGSLIVIPAGEQSKNMSMLTQVLEEMADKGLTRSDALVTLGGGVVGDLGGFAAASYMRGIPFVQIPTSLLAQIDSSVGGKVAVDLKAGKNLAGAFYQPKGVLIDPLLLKTLPVRYLHDGLAEAIKYGCIQDSVLFVKIAGLADDKELLAESEKIIAACCRIKAGIVEQDEFDTGLRMLLNFGHTLGHAIEQYYGYSSFTHGEGVAIGMYQLTKRCEAMGLTKAGCAEKIKAVLEKYALPWQTQVPKQELLATMGKDKKKNGKEITLIILDEIGSAKLHKINWRQMPEFVE